MLSAPLRSQLAPAVARLQPRLGAYFATETTTSSSDPLKGDTRTQGPQEKAHETDEATKDSIRHAAEGKVGEAVKDIGSMAAGAAKGAAESAKLMADSLKEKAKGSENPAKEEPATKGRV